MDPEFQRALMSVLVVGAVMATVIITLLFVIFRQLGSAKRPASHVIIVVGLLAFIVVCCAVLLLVSHE